jgi:hypothetical protein
VHVGKEELENVMTNPNRPRPILVEFGNMRFRDRFLAASEVLRNITNGTISISPDDLVKRSYSTGAANTGNIPRLNVTKKSPVHNRTLDCNNIPMNVNRKSFSQAVQTFHSPAAVSTPYGKEAEAPKNGAHPRA